MSEAARAEDLHRSSPVFVGHDHYCDEGHLLAMHLAGLAGKVTLASVDARVFADVEDRERSLHEYTGFTEPAWREMKSIRAIVDAHPEALLLARGAGDIVRAHDTGRSAVLLGFEGGKPIERDLGCCTRPTDWACACCSSPGPAATTSVTGATLPRARD